MKIIKRNGQEEEFNKQKIIEAVSNAILEVDGNLFNADVAYIIAYTIEEYLLAQNTNVFSVEEIQDIVEEELMASNRKDVARAYIRYRYKRENARLAKDDFMKAITEKLEGSNIQNQNANVDEASFGGRKGEAANELMKKYALDFCMSKLARERHLNNEIYTHDLDNYAVGCHNCLTIPFDHLLAEGFNTRQVDIRPAKSVDTAFQLVAVIFQLQSLQQFGGVSASHLDWTMVPYMRRSFGKHYKDGLEYIAEVKEIDYSIKNMLNNITEYSIEDSEWKAYNEKAYKYAIDMTTKELNRAVEGMYHNLKY